MQIHVAINDTLMNEVLAVTNFKTKEEAIEQGLKLLLQTKYQEKIRAFRGQLKSHNRRKRYSLAELLNGVTAETMSELNAETSWANEGESVSRVISIIDPE